MEDTTCHIRPGIRGFAGIESSGKREIEVAGNLQIAATNGLSCAGPCH